MYSHLEVSVYDGQDDHVFNHHELMLSSYPLCIEWLDFDPEQEVAGSLVAVGTMSPQIEVWDLDIIDCVEPAFTLGHFPSLSTALQFFVGVYLLWSVPIIDQISCPLTHILVY